MQWTTARAAALQIDHEKMFFPDSSDWSLLSELKVIILS